MISGMLILLLTLVFCIKGIAILYWTVSAHIHAYIGMFITVATIIAPITGFFAWYQGVNSKYSIDLYQKIRRTHAYFGYFMIVLC